MPVTIRLACLDDLSAIERFALDVVPAHYAPILGDEGARAQLQWWTTERMKPAVEASRVHVAVTGEKIIGVVQTGVLGEDHVVWKLYLAPEFRCQSIGADLLQHAIEPLRKVTDHVLVEHFAGNTKAAKFYDREGWTVVSIEPSRSGDPNAAVVWRRITLGT
jgi:ribosomal protein S18 acetylase RimI-like enzyme